jgi:hypothetical protein
LKTVTSLVFLAVALATASVAAANIYGPTIQAKGTIINDQVRIGLSVIPHYRVTKPGVVVTLTNCRLGQQIPLKVVDSPALMDGNFQLSYRPGRVTWKILRAPAKPDTATINLALALPHGKTGPKFCVHVAMHDNYTGQTVNRDLRIPIPALTGSSI